jgi:hypothetical protein
MYVKMLTSICLVVCGISLLAEGDLLQNPGVSKSGWSYWMHPDLKKSGATIAIKMTVPDSCKGSPAHYLQLIKENINIPAERKYKFSFRLKAAKDGSITISYILGKKPFTCYASEKIKISAGEKEYSVVLVPKAVKGSYATPRSLRFFVANLAGEIIISDVSLEELPEK